MPHQNEFKELDKSKHGLKPIEMEIFQGFIFVRLISTDAPSVANQFSPYLEEIKPYRFEELEPLTRPFFTLSHFKFKNNLFFKNRRVLLKYFFLVSFWR